MSEQEMAALLLRYEGRVDGFATLIRVLVADVREARRAQDVLQDRHERMVERLLRIQNITAERDLCGERLERQECRRPLGHAACPFLDKEMNEPLGTLDDGSEVYPRKLKDVPK